MVDMMLACDIKIATTSDNHDWPHDGFNFLGESNETEPLSLSNILFFFQQAVVYFCIVSKFRLNVCFDRHVFTARAYGQDSSASHS